ncbi:4Fe-4S binding protein [Limnochorda pilosa]|uniref:4Fe-4S ferredoxin-type domain-containing protein n=1 Tax=Limnochorda pilosa TaxID=1555112 RepID=A0A0K2SQ73_LIMPI|nr:4Fe-4S binding protein [Limnochorda pilosa]BAS29278.1 hypothetical protein LIP_3466 [Limnochorda pilosa]
MPFRFRVNGGRCFNCGVCVDVCPVATLDMTRPKRPGPEGTFTRETDGAKDWMMAFPIQTRSCIGCRICEIECPVLAITIEEVEAEPSYAERQGPIFSEPEERDAWIPLSTLTRAAARDRKNQQDPWPGRAWKTHAQARKRVGRFFRLHEGLESS